ncbi:hypothetical protein AVEN_94649-1 [Araneus ventricosus]|uniref:GAG-pre-integrase domain-containing protein n=1 Tax=Araneus ventricosus TaxID=182803 RepID=A0A4Y2N3R3_ARAVE|nr:hypothetical protein AVEN_94649-1 [Araneus ventricosus]
MLVKGKWNTGSLTDVWYLLESAQDLFSSGAALDKRIIEFADNKQKEFENKNGYTVTVGIRYNGVYKLLMRILVPESACVGVKNNILQLWHERMCHQNKRYVQKFSKSKGINVQLYSEFCNACIYGKMHRLNFGNRQYRPSSPGKLVHADVCDPMPEKYLAGNRYFVAFKYDYSKYRTVYLIKEKSEQKRRQFDKKDIKGYSVGYCDEITSEKISIEIAHTQSTEEVCEEDASCIDAEEETEIQNIDNLNTSLKTKVHACETDHRCRNIQDLMGLLSLQKFDGIIAAKVEEKLQEFLKNLEETFNVRIEPVNYLIGLQIKMMVQFSFIKRIIAGKF